MKARTRMALTVTLLGATLAAGSVVAFLAYSASQSSQPFGSSLVILTVLSLVVALMSITFAVMARFSTKALIPVRIAVAGTPGAGKTVLANVVYQLLMERTSAYLQFSPETRSAQAVFQVMQGLAKGKWPAPTSSDGIRLLRGKVVDARNTFRSRLLFGRVEFDLEIADSAGEVWAEFAKEYRETVDQRPLLTQSTFYEYIAGSSAILYLLDSESLIKDPSNVRLAVEDLVSTVNLLQSSTQGDWRTHLRLGKPIGLVFSKSDQLSDLEFDVLHDLFGEGEFSAAGLEGLSPRFLESLRYLERLKGLLERVVDRSDVFFVSSVGALLDADLIPRLRVPGRRRRRPSRGDEARMALLPVEWAITRTWRAFRDH
jgi:GTPase SAR1 family protein